MWPPFSSLTFPLKSKSTGPYSDLQAIFSTLSTWLHLQTLSRSLILLQPPRLPFCPSCTLGKACVPSAQKCSSFRNLHNSLSHPLGPLLKCQFSNEAFYNFFVKNCTLPPSIDTLYYSSLVYFPSQDLSPPKILYILFGEFIICLLQYTVSSNKAWISVFLFMLIPWHLEECPAYSASDLSQVASWDRAWLWKCLACLHFCFLLPYTTADLSSHPFIHLSIHSFNKYLFTAFNVALVLMEQGR